MNIPLLTSQKQVADTNETEPAQQTDSTSQTHTGLSSVKDKVQSALAESSKFEELIQQSEYGVSNESTHHKGGQDDQEYKSTNAGSRAQTQAPKHGEGTTSSHSSSSGANHVPSDASPPDSRGNRILDRGQATVIYHSNGTADVVEPNGDIVHANKDGSGSISHSDGSVDYYDKYGNHTGHKDKDGKMTLVLEPLSDESTQDDSTDNKTTK
ncbi:MAG TPA: hypothetical protein VFG11_03350 [Acidobacteriota bacterium]|nr:hypothetical protein [Acidobacteriota bacterium]